MKKPPPANTDQKQVTGRFKPGQSGNPKGKRPGTRHKNTMLAMALMESEVQGIARAVIESALMGDLTAAKLIMERLIPPAKDHPIDCKLPKVKSVSDLAGFTAALLAAVAAGKIGASEAEKLCKIVSAHQGSVELSDINDRLTALEGNMKK